MPDGTFSLVHSAGHGVGARLATHPGIKAVGFTGSLRGGRALYDMAAGRPEPVPVYAEMGSANPVFLLPGALTERAEDIADNLASSVTLACGQFCTNPGLILAIRSEALQRFIGKLAEGIGQAPAGTMVHPTIKAGFDAAFSEVTAIPGVQVVARSAAGAPLADTRARPALLSTDAATYLAHERLQGEVFGPSTMVVVCGDQAQMLRVARSLHGHLTSTVHAEETDLAGFADLIEILRTKAGRLIYNGVPTGVEVCPAMQHGGPYPATTDSRTTSVGTAAIVRFARPVCWQNFPAGLLPIELKDDNPRGIWRLVDGELTREPL
jgi:NADP-dependent aldehyde dehydrogenase